MSELENTVTEKDIKKAMRIKEDNMSVIPVESIPKKEVNERLEALKADIREIIEKRIRMAEIEFPPYSPSVMRDRITTAIRKVLWEYAIERGYNHLPGRSSDVFKIERRHIEGMNHWYVLFDADRWDAEWKRIMETEET